nr:toll-like receptor 4 [Lytechinus pictus]
MATVIDFQTVSFSQQQRGMQRLEANLETLVNVEKQCTIDLVIKKVYCPHRNLTEVPDDLLMDVEILDLQSNRIHTLNQLDCNCKIAWLLDWLQSSSNLKLVAESKTICSMASLENLGGKPLLTFDPKHYCGPDIGLLCSLPLALVGVFAMMFAIHCYRWLFSYKLFLLKLAVVGYQENVDARHHGDFEYDIMFLEDDEQWVQEHLRPVLEERLPNFNKIVFGDEDLVIGMHYFDAVFHAVEKSFKTVLLFSRAAFQDNWFMIKFRVAFEQVNDARMENVVVIFIEDIPDAELPYLVRLYLSERRTYLWWVEDERHQEYFWNELILTLQSDNMRWNNMIPLE